MELQTAQGARRGPSDVIPPMTRRTYDLGDYVVSYDVSTRLRHAGGGYSRTPDMVVSSNPCALRFFTIAGSISIVCGPWECRRMMSPFCIP